jgi:uncharacterized protein (TIGR04255 family)
VIDARVLPSFEHPPVQEVAMAIQFTGCDGLNTVHFGEFWDSCKSEFPVVDDLPPFASLEARAEPELSFVQLPPLRRIRMSTPDASLSIQLQETRLITNWVKSRPDIVYPRFGAIFKTFEDYHRRLSAFFEAKSIGRIEPTHYELTYVNEIADIGESLVPRLESLLGFCKWSHIERQFLPDPAVVNFAWQFDMPNDAGTLILNVNPAKRSNGQEVILFVLKCLVATEKTPSTSKVWFEAAHEAIVRSFAELTTADAHKLWGKEKSEPNA